ncbi:SNF2 family N-terminal domain-domain-containing protein [Kockovaella imperatae]|uniref:SNF2 family N-terminal domain-domain-containing protein n=1 Tax=Kockovaella imperatae TaxID=4999 RepID=A0A1Y1UCG6_9TREE|nr:SNF2 family N-terminal domain-domain-containing protein [Kockovaella imperatae]ORX35743.1 SNF2 family N-terminal domain-domain-containing protein [Kockovaella imperatae]
MGLGESSKDAGLAPSVGQGAGSAKRVRSDDQEGDERINREVKEETPEPDEHYVTFRSDVVGVQYYRGLVGKFEYVSLRRQPENQYDSSAVQVVNTSGIQVGHIPRAVAAKLAFLMDGKVISVEGRMVGQNLDGAKHFKLAIDVSIYGSPRHKETVMQELSWAVKPAPSPPTPSKGKGKGHVLGTGAEVHGSAGSGTGLPTAPVDEEMRRLLDGLKKIGEDEKHADSIMDSLTSDIDVSKLPLHPSPPGIQDGTLKTDLLPHQCQALQWMVSHEHPVLPSKVGEPPVQFWTRQEDKATKSTYWLNAATRSPQKETPLLGRGGIVADGMGLGKTLTVLSLILATKSATKEPSKATLIVCPLSVVSNWEKQIRDHVSLGKLSSYTYHGANREVTNATLHSYDVVITTYQTVASEAPAEVSGGIASSQTKKAKLSNGALFAGPWKRIVADEGHVLKNPRAKMTKAFAALAAERRWICTGTPIVNSPSDLGSLLTCLRLCAPLDKTDYFKALLLRPLRNGDPAAGKLLQALVGQILIRRTKDTKNAAGEPIVQLPPIEFFQVPVQLDEDTRLLYDEVLVTSQRRFQEALSGGQGGTANILSLLTRMRQLCLCQELVPQSFFDELRRKPTEPAGETMAISSMSDEQREGLVEKLRRYVADEEDCSICFLAPLRQPTITDCGHSYCHPCIDEWLNRDLNCPQCRHAITSASLLSLPAETSDFVEPDDNASAVKSAKITELVKYLELFDMGDKTLVFSQFTSFLDHVAATLKQRGILFCRFDGSMPGRKREEVIQTFQNPVTEKNVATNPRVMLISLKSGAVGLNLTTASNVFLCDPWWQSAIEAQAIDRVHRMGQKKPVRVFQLIAEDTIESRVLEIQKHKDALVAKAFEKTSKGSGGSNPQDKRRARFDELKALLLGSSVAEKS